MLRVAEDVEARFSEGGGELAVECREGCVFALGEFRLAVLPASFANPLQDGVAGDSVDLRIAKSLVGCFPFLFGELSARWKCFRDLRGLREFCDHSTAEGDRESFALVDSAEELGEAGFGFGGADLDWGLGGYGVVSCSEAEPERLVFQLLGNDAMRWPFPLFQLCLPDVDPLIAGSLVGFR